MKALPGWQWAGIALWMVLAVLGMGSLTEYSATAGRETDFPEKWPAHSSLDYAPTKPTMVLVLHPHCPCSRATVEEFSRILADAPTAAKTYVLLAQPPEADGAWSDTELAASVRALPGVEVLVDIDEVETSHFGAVTSGTTLLFDTNGALRFAGGITASRGHAGDNLGAQTLAKLLAPGAAAQSDLALTPVFGCPLQTPNRTPHTPNTGERACCSQPL